MLKFFFPVLDVGFSELRQIALTFCHSNVNKKAGENKSPKSSFSL